MVYFRLATWTVTEERGGCTWYASPAQQNVAFNEAGLDIDCLHYASAAVFMSCQTTVPQGS